MNIGLHTVWQDNARMLIGVQRIIGADLLEVRLAFDAVGRRPRFVQGGHQHGSENRYNLYQELQKSSSKILKINHLSQGYSSL